MIARGAPMLEKLHCQLADVGGCWWKNMICKRKHAPSIKIPFLYESA